MTGFIQMPRTCGSGSLFFVLPMQPFKHHVGGESGWWHVLERSSQSPCKIWGQEFHPKARIQCSGTISTRCLVFEWLCCCINCNYYYFLYLHHQKYHPPVKGGLVVVWSQHHRGWRGFLYSERWSKAHVKEQRLTEEYNQSKQNQDFKPKKTF